MLVNRITDIHGLKLITGTVSVATIVTVIFIRYFSDDKFLSGINLDNKNLILTYFNSLTEKDQLLIRDESIKDIIIKRKKFLWRFMNTITFVSEKNMIKFFVFDAELNRIEHAITLFRVKQY